MESSHLELSWLSHLQSHRNVWLLKQDPYNSHILTFISEFIIFSLYLHFILLSISIQSLSLLLFCLLLDLFQSILLSLTSLQSISCTSIFFFQSTKVFKNEPCWKQIIMTKISPWLLSLRKYHHHSVFFHLDPLVCKYLFIWLCRVLVVMCRDL